MRFVQKLKGCIAIVVAGHALHATELYNLDFQPPEVGSYNLEGWAGIVSSVGPFDNALVLRARPPGWMAMPATLSLPVGYSSPMYHIQFDLLPHQLSSSEYMLAVVLDTPYAQTVGFDGVWPSFSVADDKVFHVDMTIDIPAHRWLTTLDDTTSIAIPVDVTKLSSIRFVVGSPFGNPAESPSTYVALDNIVVTAIPEPSVGSLSLAGLLLLGANIALRRRSGVC